MIQINLLTTGNSVYDSRLPSTVVALGEFFNIREDNKQKVKLRVYCSLSDMERWNSVLSLYNCDSMDVRLVVLKNDEYMLKVDSMKNTDCEYMCKWDDDVFINRYVWDYMIDNIDTLDDPAHSVMSPIFTNGIPSVDLFVEDFMNEEERAFAHSIFLSEKVVPDIWGCNYAPLNEQISRMTSWNSREYWQMVNVHDQTAGRSVPWFYHIVKGVHPARFSYNYNKFIVDFTVRNRDIVFAKGDYYLDDTFFTPYFCNNLFLCRSDFYRASQNEFFDHWDEGQLTMLAQKNNQVPVYVRNSYGIHMAYGCTPHQKELEKLFCDDFFRLEL